jgi:hypothetical protein
MLILSGRRTVMVYPEKENSPSTCCKKTRGCHALGGSAAIKFPHQIAPTIMMGFGNLIPRTGKHLSIPFEFGAAFMGTPRVNCQCSAQRNRLHHEGCFDAATNTEVQQNLADEVIKLKKLDYIPVYPIVSIGLAYRF